MLTLGDLAETRIDSGTQDMTLKEAASLLSDGKIHAILFREDDSFRYLDLKMIAVCMSGDVAPDSRASEHTGPAILFPPDEYLYKAIHKIEELRKKETYLLLVGTPDELYGVVDPSGIRDDIILQARIAADIEKKGHELDGPHEEAAMDPASRTLLEEQLDRFIVAASRMQDEHSSEMEDDQRREEKALRRELSDELRDLLGLEPGFGEREAPGTPSKVEAAPVTQDHATMIPPEPEDTDTGAETPDSIPGPAWAAVPPGGERHIPADSSHPTPEKQHARKMGVSVDQGKKSVSVIYSALHILHRSTNDSPEDPSRLTRAMNLLDGRLKVFDRTFPLISDITPVSKELLECVHDPDYIEFIRSYSEKGGGFLGDSTYMNYNSFQIASLAAGASIQAAERVIEGKEDFSFALVRPPGHHASRENYGGYCLFNNAALTVRHLLGKKGIGKVMILDWDVHAANGTQAIFYNDPDVLLLDIHQDPATIYPHSGFPGEIGEGKGKGTNVNVPMPPGASDEDYLRVLREIVDPVMAQFEPDFVIGCCGFDAHFNESAADINMTMAGYYSIAEFLRRRIPGSCALIMEGGYHHSIGPLILTVLEGLSGRRRSMRENTDAIVTSMGRKKRVRDAMESMLFDVKTALSEHFVFE